MKRKPRIDRRIWIGAALLVAVVAVSFRIALPYLATGYVNKLIRNVDSLDGSIERIEFGVWRGAARVKGLDLKKLDEGGALEGIRVKEADISLQWTALLRGRFVGELLVKQPEVGLRQVKDEPIDPVKDIHWTKRMADLAPISINRFEVKEGKLVYLRISEDKVGDLEIRDISLVATNLSNVAEDREPLPSEYELSARLFDVVPVMSRGRINLMQEIPAMEADLEIEDIELADLNDFAEQFVNLQFHGGSLSLYSEWVVKEAKIDGYLKFLGQNIDIFDMDKEYENPLRFLWEAAAGLLVQSVKNQKEDQLASRVPFSGELKAIDSNVGAAISTLLRNAFIEALSPGVEGSVEFGSANVENER